jgi:hypothetical protein
MSLFNEFIDAQLGSDKSVSSALDLAQKQWLAENQKRFYAAMAAPSGISPGRGAMPASMPGSTMPMGAIGEVPNAAAESAGGIAMPQSMPGSVISAPTQPTALQLMQGQLGAIDQQLGQLGGVRDTPQGFEASQALMKARTDIVEKMSVAQKDQFDQDFKTAQKTADQFAGVRDQQGLDYLLASMDQQHKPGFIQHLAQIGLAPGFDGRYDISDKRMQSFIENAKQQSRTQVQRLEQEKRAADIVREAQNQVTLDQERKAKIGELNALEALHRENAQSAGKHYDSMRGGWVLPPDEKGVSKFIPATNPDGTAGSALSADARDAAAQQYLATGKLPPLYRDQVTRNAIMNRAAELAIEAGTSMVALPGKQAEFKSNSAALTANTKDLTAIRPYKEMLDTNIDIAKNLANKAIVTDYRFANKTINWLRQNAADNPDVSEYLAQIHFVSTEAARVLTNPRLVGQLTDNAIHDMKGIISGDMPLNSTIRVLDRIKSDGMNRVNAMEKENASLAQKVSGIAAPKTAPISYTETRTLPDGRVLGKKADGTVEIVK